MRYDQKGADMVNFDMRVHRKNTLPITEKRNFKIKFKNDVQKTSARRQDLGSGVQVDIHNISKS